MPLQHNDIFVLASREICDVLSISVIHNILGQTELSLEKRGQRLIDIATNTRFEHDDLTLVLFQAEHKPKNVSHDTLEQWEGSLEDILFR